MLSSANLAALKVQLDSTYVGQSNATARDALNDPAGPNAISDFEVSSVPAVEAVAAVVAAEFLALAASAQRAWLMVTGLDSIPVKNPAIRSLVQDIWTASATLTNLQALQTRVGSHAEDLFGVAVTLQDIRAARLV